MAPLSYHTSNLSLIELETMQSLVIITHCSSKKLKLPFRKTKLGIQSLSYMGPNSWNSLPDNLKSATSFTSFNPLQLGVNYLYPLKTSEKL